MDKKIDKKSSKIIMVLKEYIKFYKENIMRKHISVYIISLILFFICLAFFISSASPIVSIQQMATNVTSLPKIDIVDVLFKQNIPIVFLIMFAGITPFVYLSVIGLSVSYVMAQNIATVFSATSHNANLILMTISAIIQIFAYALAIAIGMYYCKLSTKKFKYYQTGGIGINNFKQKYYQLRGNEKKIKEVEKNQKQKDLKREKLNIKIPYLNFLISFVICCIIVAISTLISAI
ncbi:MAG: hypothetical protein RSB76_00345 [Clostridia bacterium]